MSYPAGYLWPFAATLTGTYFTTAVHITKKFTPRIDDRQGELQCETLSANPKAASQRQAVELGARGGKFSASHPRCMRQ